MARWPWAVTRQHHARTWAPASTAGRGRVALRPAPPLPSERRLGAASRLRLSRSPERTSQCKKHGQ